MFIIMQRKLSCLKYQISFTFAFYNYNNASDGALQSTKQLSWIHLYVIDLQCMYHFF